MIRSTKAIQSLIDDVKKSESMGFTYQAARFMKEFVLLHAFDGGNHRTAYSMANLFLIENDVPVRTVHSSISIPFTKGITSKNVVEIQAWIIENMIER
jgi:prophage maintenance system killer protein